MTELFNLAKNITTDKLNNDLFEHKNISVAMLRLDMIHPVVSGNKIFKLHYFLEEAKNSIHKTVITFGGAYSNHLAATAFTCNQLGLKSIGFVRGEKPETLSHTLQYCLQQKMNLEFISREDYKKISEENFLQKVITQYGGHTLIPEGGFSEKGMHGAELIYEYFNEKDFTHICCAIGTATTFAGLVNVSNNESNVIGFSVLKNITDIDKRLKFLKAATKKYSVIYDYHFGGYAKKNEKLISFMNSFYVENKIPLDFVYTGKMMFGVYDLIKKNYFPHGSKILCIHTGGLQGNVSLPKGTLNF